MEPLQLSLMSGWSGFLGGVLSGAVMGLLFHREDWLGGYGSRERRMVRLGHISFFGIGLINLFINFRPTDMSVDELRDGFRKLARRLYAPEFVDRRSRRFREHLRTKIREKNLVGV